MAKINFLFVAVYLIALYLSVNAVDVEDLFYTMPESCAEKGLSYCFEKGDDYPEEKVEDLLKKMPEFELNADNSNVLGDHIGGTDCSYNTTNKPIYYIIDKDDSVRVVVQSPKRFEQIHTVTWCLNEGPIKNDTTNFIKDVTLKKYNLECQTTTMDIEFYVLNEGINLTMEKVRPKEPIPICCKCKLLGAV